MRDINEIIVHCSATLEGDDYHASDIDRWHRAKGWNGIGYHYVVDLDGTIETGRSISVAGAHCKGHNQNSIGICYIGGLKKKSVPADTRTAAQRESLVRLISALKTCFPSIKKVSGHRDYANKACPCFDASAEYAKIK